MALVQTISAGCTNKLCDYTGTINYCNEPPSPIEKQLCPKCGFKTLSAYSWLLNTLRPQFTDHKPWALIRGSEP